MSKCKPDFVVEIKPQESFSVVVNEVKGTADTAKSTADTANSTATAAQTKANQVETALNTLTTNVGNTQTDFVAVYEAARDGSAA